MDQEARLNGRKVLAIVDGADDLPGLAQVAGLLEMDAPALMLRARRTQEGTVAELDGFAAHGAEKGTQRAVAELGVLGPRPAVVARGHQHAPPFAGRGTG